MRDLNMEKAAVFWPKKSIKSNFTNGQNASILSGISMLFPEAVIDSYMFEPCGYSCNALVADGYFSIHITPQAECSYASLETDLNQKSYKKLIRNLIKILDPGNFSVFVHQYTKTLRKSVLNKNFIGSFSGYLRSGFILKCIKKVGVVLFTNFRKFMKCSTHRVDGMFWYLEEKELLASRVKEVKRDIEKCGYSEFKSKILVLLEEISEIKTFHKFQHENKMGFLLNKLINKNEMNQSFSVLNIDALISNAFSWKKKSPNLIPIFAVEHFSNPLFLLTLHLLNYRFSCSTVLHVETLTNLGIDPKSITMANPFLQTYQIEFAIRKGVRLFSVDNLNSLKRLKKIQKEQNDIKIELIVNLDENSHFGVKLDAMDSVLEEIKILGLDFSGISFSTMKADLESLIIDFNCSLDKIKNVFGDFKENFTVNLGRETLDNPYNVDFEAFKRFSIDMKERYKSKELEIRFELSNSLIKPILTHCGKIIASRKEQSDSILHNERFNYFINDGIYQNLLFAKTNGAFPEVVARSPLKERGEKISQTLFDSVVWGRTCDSFDCIVEKANLPLLEEGDWIYFRNVSADLIDTETDFNGFCESKNMLYINFDDNKR